jgi:hypothetical protein
MLTYDDDSQLRGSESDVGPVRMKVQADQSAWIAWYSTPQSNGLFGPQLPSIFLSQRLKDISGIIDCVYGPERELSLW